MTLRFHLFTLCLGLFMHATAHAGSGHAHDDEQSAQALHGGMLSEADHLTFELVPQADKITLHVRDHGKPVSTEGATAKLTVLSGTVKSTIDLTPSGAGQLSAALTQPVAAGSKVVALVKLQGRKATQPRFTLALQK